MSDSPNKDDPYKLYMSVRCGVCGDSTSAHIRGSTDTTVAQPMDLVMNTPVPQTGYIMVRCFSCNGGNLLKVRRIGSIGSAILTPTSRVNFGKNLKIVQQWPDQPKPKIPAHLPDTITTVYKEAEQARIARLYSSATIQYRRALELTCKDLGETGGQLAGKIKALGAKQRISPDMVEWANHIKFLGNNSVHDAPLPIAEAEEQANEARYFTELFLTYVYTLPKRIAERRTVVSEE